MESQNRPEKAKIITNGNTMVDNIKLDGKKEPFDISKLDIKKPVIDSITGDMNFLIDSYKIIHKYKSLFCSWYEDVNQVRTTIREIKLECHFVFAKELHIYMYQDNVFRKCYTLKELIELCTSWDKLDQWYKFYNEQTANGTIFEEN